MIWYANMSYCFNRPALNIIFANNSAYSSSSNNRKSTLVRKVTKYGYSSRYIRRCVIHEKTPRKCVDRINIYEVYSDFYEKST